MNVNIFQPKSSTLLPYIKRIDHSKDFVSLHNFYEINKELTATWQQAVLDKLHQANFVKGYRQKLIE